MEFSLVLLRSAPLKVKNLKIFKACRCERASCWHWCRWAGTSFSFLVLGVIVHVLIPGEWWEKEPQRGQEHDLDFHPMMNKAQWKTSSKSHCPARGIKSFSSPDYFLWAGGWFVLPELFSGSRNFRWDGRRKLSEGRAVCRGPEQGTQQWFYFPDSFANCSTRCPQ